MPAVLRNTKVYEKNSQVSSVQIAVVAGVDTAIISKTCTKEPSESYLERKQVQREVTRSIESAAFER